MYQVQEHPDQVAFTENGNRITPILTLKDEYGGVSHIADDDGCFVLYNGSKDRKFVMVNHWYPEAVDAMKTLPTPPVKEVLGEQ